jgi:hypothetical protein
MRETYRITIIAAILAIAGIGGLGVVTAGNNMPAASADATNARFDYLVREDFFAGIAGDDARFDRAMQLCEDTLRREPGHAEAMVWHGGGLLVLGRRAFRANDAEKAIALMERGIDEMAAAVRLAPDAIGVRIVRGGFLLVAARQMPIAEQARAMTETGVADYEHVLGLQRASFDQLSTHARGELLAGPAEGWRRLGDTAKSRAYLSRMVNELSATPYKAKAEAWLARDGWTNGDALSCTTGCHTP